MLHRYFILFVAVLFVGGIWYYQYDAYRSPVESETTIMDSTADQGSDENNQVAHSVPLEDIQIVHTHRDEIPSIVEPSFESVYSADYYLDDTGFGIMVEHGGQQRFYPYQILVWHEAVNDVFGGENLLVTYCPLCFAGRVYDREVGSEVLEFGVSGKVYDNNVLMYDRTTESYWSQMLGEAVVGEKTGTHLERYPSIVMTWQAFKSAYPNGRVLSRDTGFERDYTQDPYDAEGYYQSADIWFTLSHEDGRLHAKELIFGTEQKGGEKAYPADLIEEQGLINDVVGDVSIVIFWDTDVNAPCAFSRQVDGNVLNFEMTDDFLKDKETGSLWNFNGEAVSGDYRGVGMNPVSLEPSLWFCWATTYPETQIYQY